MSSWLKRALAAQNRVAHYAHTIGVPQCTTMVVLKRWRDYDKDNQVIPKRELFETLCYADFTSPEEGKSILGGQVVTNHDYHVRGISLATRPASDFIETSASFWLGAKVVANEVRGGFACDLLTYREKALTLDLYLRKKPDER